MSTLAEQWMKEGEQRILQKKDKWVDEGRLKNSQEMLIGFIQDRFDIITPHLIDKIKQIQSIEVLPGLSKKVWKVEDLNEFTQSLDETLSSS